MEPLISPYFFAFGLDKASLALANALSLKRHALLVTCIFACPVKGECKHFVNTFGSAGLPLSGPERSKK